MCKGCIDIVKFSWLFKPFHFLHVLALGRTTFDNFQDLFLFDLGVLKFLERKRYLQLHTWVSYQIIFG